MQNRIADDGEAQLLNGFHAGTVFTAAPHLSRQDPVALCPFHVRLVFLIGCRKRVGTVGVS